MFRMVSKSVFMSSNNQDEQGRRYNAAYLEVLKRQRQAPTFEQARRDFLRQFRCVKLLFVK